MEGLLADSVEECTGAGDILSKVETCLETLEETATRARGKCSDETDAGYRMR